MARQVKLLKALSLVVAVALVITLAPPVSVIGEEVITLTTIMPGQDTLRVERGVVGVDWRPTATLSDEDIGPGNLLIQGKVGIGTTSPGATLEVSSTTSGFLPPRMTEAQRDAISNPPKGSIIYNTDSGSEGLNHYDGTSWKVVGGGALPLVSVGFHVTTASWVIMVAAVPSSGRIYLRALKGTGSASLDNPSQWGNWVDFGIPDASSEIIAVSAGFDYSTHLYGLITVRMSNGKVYVRSLEGESPGANMDNPSSWGSWTDFGNPGL